tara:strand:- start:2388 stop:3284 length:897 start_codon:yes stop_codon:yes gene_type:complete
MKILSIDVGITNLALVSCELSLDFEIETVIHCELCNIRDMCLFCTDKNCVLQHEKTPLDWVNHLVLFRKKVFDAADVILIERQPPGGLKDVEILLFEKFRERVKMIHPRSLHGWMRITHLDYDGRKAETEKAAQLYVKHTKAWELNSERRHDIADAVCFTLFYAYKLKEARAKDVVRPSITRECLDILDVFSYDDLEKTPLICYNDTATFSTVWDEDREFCNYIADAWYLPRKQDNTMSEIEKNTAMFKDWVLKKKKLSELELEVELGEGGATKKKERYLEEGNPEPVCIEDYAWHPA